MTNVKIFKKSNDIVGVECSGHTGYCKNGEDIVCSALSSIVQTAVLGIKKVALINGNFTVDEQTGYLKFILPKLSNSQSFHDAQTILKTMVCGIEDLQEGYSKYINLEVVNDVY